MENRTRTIRGGEARGVVGGEDSVILDFGASLARGGRAGTREREGRREERERERERRGRERRKTEGLSRVASLGNERWSVRLIEDHREESSPRGYPRSPSRRRNLLVAMLHHAIDYRRFA